MIQTSSYLNPKGEIVSYKLTAGNVDDRQVLGKLTHGIKGWRLKDKGYISSPLAEKLKAKGLKLSTKGKKFMKNQCIDPVMKQ
ncbi:MAG: transposase [Candidatus Paracaedibacteraceae bacterium]|nr:transposase [Candidatus Paracaedibacteraceae bacterium]